MRSLVLCASLLGACVAPVDTASREASILNGDLNTADQAVVALTFHGLPLCTGTLIAPRVVLTAAHCLPPHAAETLDNIEVYFGDEVQGDGESIRAVAFEAKTWFSDLFPGDIGVLALEYAARVDPVPYATRPPEPGGTVRVIGFGANHENEQSGAGTRREGAGLVDSLSETGAQVSAGGQTVCPGDSGGTGFVIEDGVEVVALITSRGLCEDAQLSYHERVDPYVEDLIEPFVEAHPPGSCEIDGICARDCGDFDPDCPCADDGICTIFCAEWPLDSDCQAPPRECAADGTCVQGICGGPDPDCEAVEPGCGGDGVCDSSCERDSDPDCPEFSASDGSGGGCALTPEGQGPSLFLLMMALVALRRRRS